MNPVSLPVLARYAPGWVLLIMYQVDGAMRHHRRLGWREDQQRSFSKTFKKARAENTIVLDDALASPIR